MALGVDYWTTAQRGVAYWTTAQRWCQVIQVDVQQTHLQYKQRCISVKLKVTSSPDVSLVRCCAPPTITSSYLVIEEDQLRLIMYNVQN